MTACRARERTGLRRGTVLQRVETEAVEADDAVRLHLAEGDAAFLQLRKLGIVQLKPDRVSDLEGAPGAVHNGVQRALAQVGRADPHAVRPAAIRLFALRQLLALGRNRHRAHAHDIGRAWLIIHVHVVRAVTMVYGG